MNYGREKTSTLRKAARGLLSPSLPWPSINKMKIQYVVCVGVEVPCCLICLACPKLTWEGRGVYVCEASQGCVTRVRGLG